MSGNTHKAHDCPHCWRVLYSKGALTNHINNEHWQEVEKAFKCSGCGAPTEDEDGIIECDDCLLESQLRALGI